MNATLLFLLSLGAGFFGFVMMGAATSAIHEITATVWFVCAAVLLGASGICGEVQMLRAQMRKAEASGKVHTPREWPQEVAQQR